MLFSMYEKTKKYCVVAIGCAFALWGAFLNAYIPEWLLTLHGEESLAFSPPMVPVLFGFFLGIISASVFFYQNATLSVRSGFFFLFFTLLFFSFGLPFETSLIARFDTYGLCFFWALSLIAIGYILRSRPKNRIH